MSTSINLDDSDLQFTESGSAGLGGSTHTFSQVPDSALDNDDDVVSHVGKVGVVANAQEEALARGGAELPEKMCEIAQTYSKVIAVAGGS